MNALKSKRVWSLLKVLEFNAKRFVETLNCLGMLDHILTPQVTEFAREMAQGDMEELENIVRGAGLDSTADAIERLRTEISYSIDSPQSVKSIVLDIRRRMNDDLKRVLFFTVSKHKSKLAPTKPLFGEKVNDNFLSAAADIEEAGKCLALDRGTACVFHLMRVLEAGIRALASTLVVTIASDNWNTILEAVEKEIRSRRSRGATPDWLPEDERFFTEATTSFYLFKNAWRNYTLHRPVMYTPEKAEEIYTAVRSFMKHIALRIKEPGVDTALTAPEC